MKHTFYKKKKRLLITYLGFLSLLILLGYAIAIILFFSSGNPFHFYEISSFFCLAHLDAVLCFTCLLLVISIPFLLLYLRLLWKETGMRRFKNCLAAIVFFCALCFAVFVQDFCYITDDKLVFALSNPLTFLGDLDYANHAYQKGDYQSANRFYRLALAEISDTDNTRGFILDFLVSSKKPEIEKGLRLSYIALAEEAADTSGYYSFQNCYDALIYYDPDIPGLYQWAAEYFISVKEYLAAIEALENGYQAANSVSLKQQKDNLLSHLYLASVKHYDTDNNEYIFEFFDSNGTLRESYTKEYYDTEITRRELYDENGELISIRTYYDDGTLSSIRTYQNENPTFYCYFDTSGNVTRKTYLEYDTNGNLISERYYENIDGNEILTSERLYEYGAGQNITRYEYLSSETHRIDLAEYDANGNLCRYEVNTYQAETLVGQELDLYTYDSNNNMTTLQTYHYGKLTYTRQHSNTYEYNENGQLISYTSNRKASDYVYTTHEEYDENGNTISHLYASPNLNTKSFSEYDEHNTLRKSVSYYDDWLDEVFTYDENGNLLSHTSYTENGQIFFQETCTYDENGNLLLDAGFFETIGKITTIYQYDTEGNLTKEIYYCNGETTFTDYEYDIFGNLTKKCISYGNRKSDDTTLYHNTYELIP